MLIGLIQMEPAEQLFIFDCYELKAIFDLYVKPYLSNWVYDDVNIETMLMDEINFLAVDDVQRTHSLWNLNLSDHIPTDIIDHFYTVYNDAIYNLLNIMDYTLKGYFKTKCTANGYLIYIQTVKAEDLL